MIARRIAWAWTVVLSVGCAHTASEPGPTVPAPEDPMMQLRRDNAALRRRVQMLEDRVLNLEQHGAGGVAAGSARAPGTVAGSHTLPDGRSLPLVRLAPQGAPGMAAPSGPPSPDAARSPHGSEAGPDDGPDDGYESPEASQSYRLVGNRLVDLTKQNGPVRPDRPDQSAEGRPIIAEYEAAMAIYKSGQVERAERAFDAFARQHPRHDYADNALYWKGEAAYDQHHYADALAAFTDVVERYGGGNKAPDALLKIGLCYRQLGDLPNARDVLTELIAAYPGERASDIARVKLAQLSS